MGKEESAVEEWKSRAMMAMTLVEAQMREVDAWKGLYKALEQCNPSDAQRSQVREKKDELKQAEEVVSYLIEVSSGLVDLIDKGEEEVGGNIKGLAPDK